MSDEEYGSDEFDNYDEDFEGEEDYEVLPSAITRVSAPEQRPPSAQQQHHQQLRPDSGRRPGSGPRPVSPYGGQGGGGDVHVDIPPTPTLTDTQLTKRAIRMARSLLKFPHLSLEPWIDDEVFVLGGLSEYDLAAMGRGAFAGKKVGAAQTNDDAKEEEVQTEEIDAEVYGCQVPEDRTAMTDSEVNAGSVSAAGTYTPSAARGGGDVGPGGGGGATAAAPAAVMRVLHSDPGMELRLAEFVRWAGMQVLAALGVSAASRPVVLGADPAAGSGLSAGAVHLAHPALLATRPVAALAISAASQGAPLLLAAYGAMGAQLGSEALLQDHSLATKGVLCVWDLSAPVHPKAVLVSEGSPSCCGFCPAPAGHVVFAGMEEGGLCVWDLEEPDARHPVEALPDAGGQPQGSLVCRRPAFTTEGQFDLATAGSPIVAVAAAQHAESRATPAHLYSVSAWGDVNVWGVNVLAPAEARALDTELGMRVGSCVRLMRLATGVKIGLPALFPQAAAAAAAAAASGGGAGLAAGRSDAGGVRAASLAVLPLQRGAFVVGADGGRLLKGSWAGVAPAPKEYVAHDHASAATLCGAGRSKVPSMVTSVSLSPHVPWALLSGHDDGTIALHSVGSSTAAAVWHGAAPGGALAVRWAPGRPSTFLVLDGMCTVHAFDLARVAGGGPGAASLDAVRAGSQSFMAADGGGDASLAAALEAGAPAGGGGGTRLPGFAVGYDDGRVDFLALAPQFAASTDVARDAAALIALVGPQPSTAADTPAAVPRSGAAAAAAQPQPVALAPAAPVAAAGDFEGDYDEADYEEAGEFEAHSNGNGNGIVAAY